MQLDTVRLSQHGAEARQHALSFRVGRLHSLRNQRITEWWQMALAAFVFLHPGTVTSEQRLHNSQNATTN